MIIGVLGGQNFPAMDSAMDDSSSSDDGYELKRRRKRRGR